MVKVLYKGANKVYIGSYQLVNGENDVKDEDFYKLMAYKSFAARVRSGVFKVPKSFPLEKLFVEHEEKATESHEESEEHEEESVVGSKWGQKAALREIAKTDNKELLEKFSEDERPKVADAAKKRLESFEPKE